MRKDGSSSLIPVFVQQLEKVLKALANRRRLAILEYLKYREEANVGMIAKHIDLSFKATSRHLRVLFNADILDRTQRSLEQYYRLADVPHAALTPILNLL